MEQKAANEIPQHAREQKYVCAMYDISHSVLLRDCSYRWCTLSRRVGGRAYKKKTSLDFTRTSQSHHRYVQKRGNDSATTRDTHSQDAMPGRKTLWLGRQTSPGRSCRTIDVCGTQVGSHLQSCNNIQTGQVNSILCPWRGSLVGPML